MKSVYKDGLFILYSEVHYYLTLFLKYSHQKFNNYKFYNLLLSYVNREIGTIDLYKHNTLNKIIRLSSQWSYQILSFTY